MRPLYVVPVDSASGVSLPDGEPALVRLTGSEATPALAELLGVAAPAGATKFEYRIDRYPQLATRVPRTWLEPTFVIDFKEPAVASLTEEMEEYGEKPTRAALVEFVARFIDETVPRGWDPASVIAERRQGDCTEHAVLTVALARLHGIPARVAVGIALISDGTEHFAAGHAWAELRQGHQWVVADAALHNVGKSVRHLPTGILEEEGMGYKMALMALMQRSVQRVEVLGPG
jgi:transglutaminase-like putative cysteine protease